jgi:hypothetical protein
MVSKNYPKGVKPAPIEWRWIIWPKAEDEPIEANFRCRSLTQTYRFHAAGITKPVFAPGFPETRHFVATEGIMGP